MYKLQLDDPFPLESCSWRLRNAILNEFDGHCPMVRQVIKCPRDHWQAVPGIGPLTLGELRSLMQHLNDRVEGRLVVQLPIDELTARRGRLQREIDALRSELDAVNIELKRRKHSARIIGSALEPR
jgi:hypothetical protein